MTYTHTVKIMCSNQIYEFTVEDENDETAYNAIVKRVKSKIFDPANISVVKVTTNVNNNLHKNDEKLLTNQV